MSISDALQSFDFTIIDRYSTYIQGLLGVVDAHPDEEHKITIAKSDYPVESGSSLTDNAVKMPDKVSLEGWVSDLIMADNAIVDIAGFGRSTEAWGRIRELAEAREPLVVVTMLQTYDNMLITGVHCVKNKDTGRALRFKIDLEEAIFAQTKLTKLPPVSVDQDSPAANKTSVVNYGQKQCSVADEEEFEALIQSIRGA